MNNNTIQLKIKQRLNKLDSQDYDNIQCWQIVEAFNKAQIEWVRRQLDGKNQRNTGDEQSRRRIDDLQNLLVPDTTMSLTKFNIFYQSDTLPDNYLEYKRIDVLVNKECCPDNQPMVVYLAEEDNRAQLLRDEHKKPSYEWRETFATLIDNKARIFTNGDFEISKGFFTYYRKPINIEILGCSDPYTGNITAVDVECEFKDDIVELLVDETVSILGGDIESPNQYGRGLEQAERNN